MERLYTTEELALVLRTTPSTIRYWRHVGKGPKASRPGRRVLYAESDVERWFAEGRDAEHGGGPRAA